MFMEETSNRIVFTLRWWLNRGAYQAAVRGRWDRLTREFRRSRRRPPWWNAPTVANPQVGRAGLLTPAQTWRANGGRWINEWAAGKAPNPVVTG